MQIKQLEKRKLQLLLLIELKSVDEDCQGAQSAAKNLWVHANPLCRGWLLADPQAVQAVDER